MRDYPAELDSNYPPEDCVCEGKENELCEACKEVLAEEDPTWCGKCISGCEDCFY